MARSVWKGPFVDLHLLKKAQTAQETSARAPIKTAEAWMVGVSVTAACGVR